MTYADLVFTGGPVFRADPARTRASAVAVRSGRIVAVGHAEVHDLIGPGTEVVDLNGRMLLPGFTDAHVHPVWGGLDMLRCDLALCGTRAQYLEVIAAYVTRRPHDPWVLGGGWSMSAFPGGTPLASDLDAIVPDRPAFLANRDGHGAWVNSKALELAGITMDTADPVDGRIERLPDGRPSGTLHEGAMDLVNIHIPPEPPERMIEALLTGQRYLHSFGVTGWQDAIVGSDYGDAGDPIPAYLAAQASGALTGRVVGALWWHRGRGVEQIPDLLAAREHSLVAYGATLAARGGLDPGAAPGSFRATSVKIMQDGVAENYTASMTEPYLDRCGHPTDNSGISFVPPQILAQAVPALDADGFQLHFHAIGDRAVRECLDGVALARRSNGLSHGRHHIAHLQVVHPDDVPRFRQLGVAANMQSLWAALEPQMVELTLPFLGEPRSAWQYPWGDLSRAGATLVSGSDWSVSTPDPWAAIHVAVNRKAHSSFAEGDYEVFLPEQRLDLTSALAAYTAGSAWVNHLDEAGTVAVGNLADLVVVDSDPFAGPLEEIGATRTMQTFVGGRRVYAAADA